LLLSTGLPIDSFSNKNTIFQARAPQLEELASHQNREHRRMYVYTLRSFIYMHDVLEVHNIYFEVLRYYVLVEFFGALSSYVFIKSRSSYENVSGHLSSSQETQRKHPTPADPFSGTKSNTSSTSKYRNNQIFDVDCHTIIDPTSSSFLFLSTKLLSRD
jgi:hypothetical protein